MTVENISWSISTKECCRPRRGLNPRPPGLQSDGASNWATEGKKKKKLNDAKDEFEVDGAAAVFSTWRVEREDPLDIGDVEITEGIHARAGRLAPDARMADVRATQLLAALPGGTELLLRIKFLQEKAEDDWVLEDKFGPVRAERKKGQGVVEVSWDTKPGMLTGIDSVFYQKAYPVTAVVYGLYPVREPDPANLAPLRDGDLKCVAQRVVEHFERPGTYTHTAT